MVRSPSGEYLARCPSNTSVPSTPPPGPASTLVDSPTASPTLKSRTLPTDDDLFSNPQSRSARPSPPALSPLSSSARHPLLDHSTIPSSPARPTITFELASPSAKRERPASGPGNGEDQVNFRPRANSDVPAHGPKPPFRQSNSAGNETSQATSSLNMHRKTSHSPSRPHAHTTDSDLMLHHSKSDQPRNVTSNATEREEQRGAFMKFIRDLPSLLPGRTSISAPVPLVPEEDLSVRLQRRHQKGEVVCLHYGTIDDLGMRQLEGRS
jgi:hypothetical protein